jgi:Tfp pilus assembly protein PilF
VRQLQTEITNLQQAKDRNDNMTLDTKVPYYVPMALGSAYFRNNQFAEAEKEYKEAIDANPDSGETHNNLAVLYLLTGRYEQAQSEVDRAEKTGFKVNPSLKEDIKGKKKAAN